MPICSSSRFSLLLLAAALLFLTPPPARALDSGSNRVPLWPIYYRVSDPAENTQEILWPLWSSRLDKSTGQQVDSFLAPLTRFSTWQNSGDFNRYIFPFFWGSNSIVSAPGKDAGLAPEKYFDVFPYYWSWTNQIGSNQIVPPYYDIRSSKGARHWGVFPLLWRTIDDQGTFTILVPAWHSSLPMGMSSGGLFPLIWYFNHPQFKCCIAVPGWYASMPLYRSYGLFPLFWHNETGLGQSSYTNVLLLGNLNFNADGYSHSIWPLVRFNEDAKAQTRFQMIFPFWWGSNPQHIYACTFPFAWSYDRKTEKLDNWSLAPLLWHFRDLGIDGPLPLNNVDALFPIYGSNTGPKPQSDWSFYGFPLFVTAGGSGDKSYYFPYPLAGTHQTTHSQSAWLFPVFSWKRDDAAKKTEFGMLMDFLVSWTRSPESLQFEFLRFSIFLPALASYERTKDELHANFTAIYGYDRTTKAVDWDVLWILLNRHLSSTERSFKIISSYFISSKQTETTHSTTFAPFYFDRCETTKAPLDQPTTTTHRQTILFPLSYYETRAAAGKPDRLKFSLLDPLSLLRDDEDVASHYSALMHLVDYKKRDDGSSEFRLLWRLFHRTANGETRNVEMFPFIESGRAPDARSFSIGWRLFDYERQGAGKSLRLFFLPPIRWGEPSP